MLLPNIPCVASLHILRSVERKIAKTSSFEPYMKFWRYRTRLWVCLLNCVIIFFHKKVATISVRQIFVKNIGSDWLYQSNIWYGTDRSSGLLWKGFLISTNYVSRYFICIKPLNAEKLVDWMLRLGVIWKYGLRKTYLFGRHSLQAQTLIETWNGSWS